MPKAKTFSSTAAAVSKFHQHHDEGLLLPAAIRKDGGGMLPTKRGEIARLVFVGAVIILLNFISVGKHDNAGMDGVVTTSTTPGTASVSVRHPISSSPSLADAAEVEQHDTEQQQQQEEAYTLEEKMTIQRAREVLQNYSDIAQQAKLQQPAQTIPLDPELKPAESNLQTSEQELHFWTDSDCLYVENLCHVGHEWFYKPLTNTNNQTANNKTQPKFSIDVHPSLPEGYPRRITVGSGIPEGLQCSTSAITYHLVLTAYCDHMMGDFHHGVLRGAMDILKRHEDIPEEHLQLYLHPTNRDKLFDGHRIFSQALPSNNPLLGFHELLDMNRCRCLPRVAFCGYAPAVPQPPNNNNAQEGGIVYKPFKAVGGAAINQVTSQGQKIPGITKDTITKEMFKNPFMNDMVTTFRRKQLQKAHVNPDEESSWKIIGFGQRKGRRVWLKLKKVTAACNIKYRDQKILCIETSVELESSHVIMQAVMHAGLNGFIGIHGSQHVDALFMPTGSPVLELLPWFPDTAIWGRWTRSTKGTAHTWFYGTDLNHYGYPLGRTSTAHLCQETMNATNVIDDIACWSGLQSDGSGLFMWDGRDYSVDWPIIDSFLSGFVVAPPETCDEYEQRQKDQIVVDRNESKLFTMYNINCKLAADSTTTTLKNQVYVTDYTDIEVKDTAARLVLFHEWEAKQATSSPTAAAAV